MIYLIVFSFVVNVIIVGNFVYEKFQYYISVNKTFWCHKIVSFTLMMYTKREQDYSSSKGLYLYNKGQK